MENDNAHLYSYVKSNKVTFTFVTITLFNRTLLISEINYRYTDTFSKQ